MGRLRDPLLRVGYRVGYHVLRVWWFVRRPTHRGVKCVVTRGHEVLLVRHTYGRTRWELPGGGVKRREEPPDAAHREIREELGIELGELAPLGELFRRVGGKRDRLWCYAAEVGDPSIELDRAEIAECRWFPRDRLPEDSDRYVARIVGLLRSPAADNRKQRQ